MVPPKEDIPNDALVSRLVDSPLRWSRAESKYIEDKLFEFQTFKDENDYPYEEESLVWRKYVPDIEQVHGMGCQQQHLKRKRGKSEHCYEGAMTVTAGSIRKLTAGRGHGFTVDHAPAEGVWHAAVRIKRSEGWIKAHKIEAREVLTRHFATQFERHQCQEPAGVA
jgi:hypothetical protein